MINVYRFWKNHIKLDFELRETYKGLFDLNRFQKIVVEPKL